MHEFKLANKLQADQMCIRLKNKFITLTNNSSVKWKLKSCCPWSTIHLPANSCSPERLSACAEVSPSVTSLFLPLHFKQRLQQLGHNWTYMYFPYGKELQSLNNSRVWKFNRCRCLKRWSQCKDWRAFSCISLKYFYDTFL